MDAGLAAKQIKWQRLQEQLKVKTSTEWEAFVEKICLWLTAGRHGGFGGRGAKGATKTA